MWHASQRWLARGILALVVLVPGGLAAQSPVAGFAPGHRDLGIVVGIGGIGSASVAPGVRFEAGLFRVPDLWDGVIGVRLGLDRYTHRSGPPAGPGNGADAHRVRERRYPVSGLATYHLALADRRWDPFLGVGVVYLVRQCPGGGPPQPGPACRENTLSVAARAGVRYLASDRMSYVVELGSGTATLAAGLAITLP